MVCLHNDEVTRAAAATGVAPDCLRAMTPAHYDGTALVVDRENRRVNLARLWRRGTARASAQLVLATTAVDGCCAGDRAGPSPAHTTNACSPTAVQRVVASLPRHPMAGRAPSQPMQRTPRHLHPDPVRRRRGRSSRRAGCRSRRVAQGAAGRFGGRRLAVRPVASRCRGRPARSRAARGCSPPFVGLCGGAASRQARLS
jgi:hypothetical protein